MIEELWRQKATLVSYLLSKVTAEDWHGVADAAMDLREIEAKLDILETQEKDEQRKQIRTKS